MTTPENGRATITGEPDGERFLADLDAALQGHEPDGSHADTARFASQLAGVLQSQTGSAPEHLKQKISDVSATPAATDSKPSTVVRMDRALRRFRLGLLDLAAIVALTVLGVLIWRSLDKESVAQPDLKSTDAEKRLAAEDRKPPAPDAPPLRGPIEEPWEKEIRAKLERKVSFEFVDTPFEEVIGFLRSLANVTIIVSPDAAATGALQSKVTLRAKDMTLGVALQWIARMSELNVSLREHCLFVSGRDSTPVEMRVLDVSGLPISADLLALVIQQKFDNPKKDKSETSVGVIGNLVKVAQTREASREIYTLVAAIREQAPSGKISFQPLVVPEWKKAMQEQLKKKITFEFVDTPLEDTIDFFQKTSGINIIVDPAIAAAGTPVINLRVTDMDLSHALEWSLRLANCTYSLENEALFITKTGRRRPVLIGYDVASILKDRGMTSEALHTAVITTVAPTSWNWPTTSITVSKKDTWMFVQQDESVQLQVESLLHKLANPEKP